jgi:hypothetical protein
VDGGEAEETGLFLRGEAGARAEGGCGGDAARHGEEQEAEDGGDSRQDRADGSTRHGGALPFSLEMRMVRGSSGDSRLER